MCPLGPLSVRTAPLEFDCACSGGAVPSGLVLLAADYTELVRVDRIEAWPWRAPAEVLAQLASGATVHAFATGDSRTGPAKSPLATFVAP